MLVLYSDALGNFNSLIYPLWVDHFVRSLVFTNGSIITLNLQVEFVLNALNMNSAHLHLDSFSNPDPQSAGDQKVFLHQRVLDTGQTTEDSSWRKWIIIIFLL